MDLAGVPVVLVLDLIVVLSMMLVLILALDLVLVLIWNLDVTLYLILVRVLDLTLGFNLVLVLFLLLFLDLVLIPIPALFLVLVVAAAGTGLALGPAAGPGKTSPQLSADVVAGQNVEDGVGSRVDSGQRERDSVGGVEAVLHKAGGTVGRHRWQQLEGQCTGQQHQVVRSKAEQEESHHSYG